MYIYVNCCLPVSTCILFVQFCHFNYIHIFTLGEWQSATLCLWLDNNLDHIKLKNKQLGHIVLNLSPTDMLKITGDTGLSAKETLFK